MGMAGVKALIFDTGSTILDWHSGFRDALAAAVARHRVDRNWPAMANALCRAALGRMLNRGAEGPPTFNFDGAHRAALDEVLAAHDFARPDEAERQNLAYDVPHNFTCWDDFPVMLLRLRAKMICASFTILSFRIIIDTAPPNGLSWDAVSSCEGIGNYKPLPEAYETGASFLQLKPKQVCMVVCHNFDLDAAKRVGFETAFVRRPAEWETTGPPDPTPNADHGLVDDDFQQLAAAFGT